METYRGAFEPVSFARRGGEEAQLVIFGTSHVTNLDHPQFLALKTLMDQGGFGHVLLERRPALPPDPGSDADIVKQFSEFGYVVSHYRQDPSAELTGIDPPRDQVVRHLITLFDARNVQTALTLRRLVSPRFRTLQTDADRRAYINRALESARSGLGEAAGEEWFDGVDDFLRFLHEEWPGLSLQSLDARWFSPLQTSQQTGSHFINDVMGEESLFRSRFMHEEIASTLQRSGSTPVLVVVGTGHAYALQDAVACLAEMKGLVQLE